jgi:hypothetical protein
MYRDLSLPIEAQALLERSAALRYGAKGKNRDRPGTSPEGDVEGKNRR